MIRNAWLYTIEEGIHTADIYNEAFSNKKVSTMEFADAIISNFGKSPVKLKTSNISGAAGTIEIPEYKRSIENKELVGIDVFIDWEGSDPEQIGNALENIDAYNLKLKMITNRGVKVFPNGQDETYCTDHWRCRFVCTSTELIGDNTNYEQINHEDIINLLAKLNSAGFRCNQNRKSYTYLMVKEVFH